MKTQKTCVKKKVNINTVKHLAGHTQENHTQYYISIGQNHNATVTSIDLSSFQQYT